MLKAIIILTMFQISGFSNQNENATERLNLDSIINDFVNIDNKIDLATLIPNTENFDSNLSQIKKELNETYSKQTKLLLNCKISKEDKSKFKLMKLYSLKIKTKFLRLQKTLNSSYRLSPSSSKIKTQPAKDLLSANLQREKVEKEIKEIIESANKTLATSRWLYNISK
ncbi:MAG TPA: hypothetical protein PK103_03570 [Elusimicrobiales bacterium]|nr:hypothetical protein [Elusimicrobiales bacterium]HOL62432.1 hypothetical protein [Elusimicrobiales bacterium]HPO94376.1 hypothetical protein [Elusimicrobiales bacterium]